MILISVLYSNNHFVSLFVKGHANPLICAGVSSIFVGACNALRDIENYSIQVNSGDSSIQARNCCTEHDEIVLETLLTQLETIQERYPKEIKIDFSGKKGQKNETQI